MNNEKMVILILNSSRSSKSFRFGVDCAGCQPEGVHRYVERFTPVQDAPKLELLLGDLYLEVFLQDVFQFCPCQRLSQIVIKSLAQDVLSIAFHRQGS